MENSKTQCVNNTHKSIDAIHFRQLDIADIAWDMLKNFNRYQRVKKYYAKSKDGYIIANCDFTESWDNDKKLSVISKDFTEIFQFGGSLFAAYDGNKLIGFSCIDGRFIGSESQYLQLVYLHVSFEYRGIGIGKTLFNLCARDAAEKGANKLYISAASSYSTQGFYRSIGCVLANECIDRFCEIEPYDVQMEFTL